MVIRNQNCPQCVTYFILWIDCLIFLWKHRTVWNQTAQGTYWFCSVNNTLPKRPVGCGVSSIKAQLKPHLWWIVWWMMTSPEMTSPEVALPEMTSPEPEVVNRKWKGDNFPRFSPFFSSVFPAGFPLELL
jgi:hypothetical protein